MDRAGRVVLVAPADHLRDARVHHPWAAQTGSARDIIAGDKVILEERQGIRGARL
jgi:hypothetical protein